MTAGTELTGKVALVTGGARNIGRAISRSLAAGGATVMVNANTSQGDAKNTVAMIKSNGGAAACHFADVTDPDAVAKMVDATVKQFGRLDILVNNAAVRSETHFEDIKLEEWHHVLATVLDAVDLGYRVVLVEDALCSSSDAGHDALMTLYRTRFSEQIELVKTAELPELWPEGA